MADALKIKFRDRIDSESDQVGAEIRDARLRMDTTSQLVTEAGETAPMAIARRLPRNSGRFRASQGHGFTRAPAALCAMQSVR